MMGFDAKELGYKGTQPSANDAIEEANYMYSKMYREEMNAGREIPIVDIPAGDDLDERTYRDAVYSVEAGDKCIRDANRRSYSLSALARYNYDRIFRRK
jgi:hypothetical protein